MRYRVHIDRLVLTGLPLSERDALTVGRAVEAELGRLLRGAASPTPAPTMPWAGDIARSIHRSVDRAVNRGR
ncbi:hypothetical protein M6D93_17710 [Jatrophihabitans telluris]|uniref:Uncharacterized protein n=1 Tax=Jatrophihabitans telluris TaxID=2038343 RepID=A0ABY4QXM2_9ACTN|nr:hypothetical protein [Jatrophihabitans telluris]UQX88109.1 hypothetical protein M6D93_17710 [Jatrophihabitans telluris]